MDATITRAPIQARSERPRSNDPTDFAVPTGREIDWRFAPIDRLAPLFEDVNAASPTWSVETSGIGELTYLAPGDAPRGSVFVAEDLPSAIAAARVAAAPHIRLAAGTEIEEPISVELRGDGADSRTNFHLVIEAQPASRGTVVISHTGTTRLAENVEIVVGERAELTVITVQGWEDDAIHLASHQARVDRHGSLRHIVITFGGGVVRVNPTADLAGAHSEAELFGLSFADAGQHFESQVYLHHRGPDTVGRVLYKGALQGEGARSVWVGDVLIGPDARGTDSYEANRNLVLTDGARADSIPNLEIETGDIVGAGHASATGRFDDEQLFYLQARGIPEADAKRLVVLGFLAEIAQKVDVPELQAELIDAIEAELAKGVV